MPPVRSTLPAGALPVLLLCFSLLLPLAASAQDWNYRVRPGDTLWDLGAQYLKPDVGWQQLQQHNHVDNPYRLPPGQALRFPVAWLRVEPAPARVLAVRGQVQLVNRAGTVVRAVVVGGLLQAGDRLRTGADASVTLEFADASRLQLREQSDLQLDTLSRYGRTGMVDTRMRLQQGRTSNRVTPAKGPASRYIIDAPTATSSVRGTVFRVAAGGSGGSASTEVLEGRVQVGNRSGQRLVGRGQAARSPDATTRPRPATALLPAPLLIDQRLRLDPPLQLAWHPVAGATSYRIDVVRADAPEILLATATTIAAAVHILDALPAGALQVLVRGVDDAGVEGMDSARRFEVLDQPAPPITASPVHDENLNTDRPRFQWSEVPGAVASVLQVADEPGFTAPLVQQQTSATRLRLQQTLPPGRYYWRVASLDAAGQRGRFGQALPLTLTREPIDPALQPPQSKGRMLTLRWQPGEPGQRYRVQVARDAQFQRMLLDEFGDQPQVSFKRPWRGTLHVRVQYIDDDGHAGPFSPVQQLPLSCRACAVAGGGSALLWLLL